MTAATLYTPAFFADPYPTYRVLRDRGPVVRDGHTWIVTRHTHIKAAAHDPRLRKGPGDAGAGRGAAASRARGGHALLGLHLQEYAARRSARPHAPAWAGEQGVHPTHGADPAPAH